MSAPLVPVGDKFAAAPPEQCTSDQHKLICKPNCYADPKPLRFAAVCVSAIEAGRIGMTVNTTGRSHRVVYLIALLIYAVALTTALVLAGEHKPEGNKSSSQQSNTVPALNTVCLSGKSNV